MFTITVIGGLTSLPGAILGAIWVEGVPFLFNGSESSACSRAASACSLLLLIVPGGLSEIMYRGRDTFLRWVAKPQRASTCPSLVSDSLVAMTATELAHAVEAPSPIGAERGGQELLVAKVAAPRGAPRRARADRPRAPTGSDRHRRRANRRTEADR